MSVQSTRQSASVFLGDLSALNLNTEYRSLKENSVEDFYRPCLLNSTSYKRATSFFKSTVYNIIGTSVIEFARRGGYTQIICSPELSEEDIDSIAFGYARKSKILENSLVQQVEALLASHETAFNTRVLATLISIGSLDIKIAVRADKKGLYHEKIGIFSDDLGNAVSFKGSANETWRGWHLKGNFESIEVFCNWRGGLEAERVKKHEIHFDTLWSENDPDIEVFSFPTNAIKHLEKAAFRGLDAIDHKGISTYSGCRNPLPHQEAAIEGWLLNGGRGIFEHATGSGKTYTALIAIRKHIEKGNPALVIVPSRLLLEQWNSEISEELPEVALLLAGGGKNAWRIPERLKGMTDPDTANGSRIVLATMQTASMPEFRRNITDGNHLLLVADEVHQLGSPHHSKVMNINAGYRLGLSATPTRYGDPDGTKKIFDYFNGVIPPSITLSDAIKVGRLVPYEYFPHTINLSGDEADEWSYYTKQISQEIARQRSDDTDVKFLSEKVKLLLIRRSRIAKKAEAKVHLASSIIKKCFEKGQSWLVYCEDIDQLEQVISALKNDGINPVEYHSKMQGDRTSTMSWFRSFGGVLVSIRCLDEGVDIPDVSHALVLASSQNPRQFIQRRGRVLRRAPGKHIAVVHDSIILPVNPEREPEQISLLKSELLRAIEFSNHSINKGANAELRRIAIDMGINPDNLFDSGFEETDEEV